MWLPKGHALALYSRRADNGLPYQEIGTYQKKKSVKMKSIDLDTFLLALAFALQNLKAKCNVLGFLKKKICELESLSRLSVLLSLMGKFWSTAGQKII